jgi:hypothetical protein
LVGAKNAINSSIPINSAEFFKKMEENTLKPTLEEKREKIIGSFCSVWRFFTLTFEV